MFKSESNYETSYATNTKINISLRLHGICARVLMKYRMKQPTTTPSFVPKHWSWQMQSQAWVTRKFWGVHLGKHEIW